MIRSFAEEIFECAGGVEALLAYDARKPDVVLMDIRMDEVDGIQATLQIKAYDPEARVVIVTDYDDDTLRQAAIRAGACGYVLKDNLLALVQLLEMMEQALRERRTGSTEH
jgi:DNA-binding NarL/FixJ family response regulator